MSSPDQLATDLGNVLKDKARRMLRVVLTGERFAKVEAPVKRGHLRRSITHRVERGGDRGVVGTNNKYARPVHDGTGPRIIRARRAKALYWPGAAHPVKSVRHPGTRANPFLRRAAERLAPVAAEEFGRDIWSGVR